jgi:hypothetical protein
MTNNEPQSPAQVVVELLSEAAATWQRTVRLLLICVAVSVPLVTTLLLFLLVR